MNNQSEVMKKARELYKPPFDYDHGYIFDAEGHMVADNPAKEDSTLRIRGWGRIGSLESGAQIQDAVGERVAELLTKHWLDSAAPSSLEHTVRVCPEKDAVCGDYKTNWCATCPKRGGAPEGGQEAVAHRLHRLTITGEHKFEHSWTDGMPSKELLDSLDPAKYWMEYAYAAPQPTGLIPVGDRFIHRGKEPQFYGVASRTICTTPLPAARNLEKAK